jgi:hypothetical protein
LRQAVSGKRKQKQQDNYCDSICSLGTPHGTSLFWLLDYTKTYEARRMPGIAPINIEQENRFFEK